MAGIGRIAALAGLIGGAGVLAFLVLRGSSDTYEVTGVFRAANGLVQTADVRVGGLRIGKVSRIELPPGGLPRVTMEIFDDYRLREGAVADLRLASQAGQLNRFIDLKQGKGDPLQDGATLPLSQTESPVEFDDAISFLTPKTRRQARTLLRDLRKATAGHGPDLEATLRHSGPALHNTAELLQDVSADGVALSRLVRQGRAAVDALASDPAALQGTVDHLATVLQTAATRQAEVAETLRLLAPGLRSPRIALERLRGAIPELRELVRASGPLVEDVKPLSRELRPAVADARPALAQLRRVGGDLPGQLRALRPLITRGPPVLRHLTPGLRGFNPVLDDLRARAPDVFGWVPLLGDITASYDAVGHGARLHLTLTDSPRRLIGPSESGGGLLRRPFDRTPGALEGEPWEDYEASFVGGGKPVESFLTPEELRSRDQGLER